MRARVIAVPSPAIRRSICSRQFWTASRCYRISVGLGVISFLVLIILGVLVISPAIDGLSLRPATCTVIRSEIQGKMSCRCGKYCSSFHPCLKIYVDYVPEDFPDRNITNRMFHDTVYENSDEEECSVAPCTKDEQANYRAVEKFQESRGIVGQKYTCFYNPKKTNEVVGRTENFNAIIIHCTLWPMMFILISIFWMALVYYRRHTFCAPKDGQNVHLVWE
ncbi:calcium-activated potassium channel subunit beta-4 [Nematostella vectensis]|uniref:calcium-activated potassium channel subunit beta-4 n=1 Tax=Nematostella vectensis TaxID=45351 RepID=UPI0020772743|nr:calcium-activated potassium channel subunit beta-4 [Nematostella vectensis]